VKWIEHLLAWADYWALALVLACQEMFSKRGPNPQLVAAHRELHKELHPAGES
jgi:hypothetical protein